MNFLTKLSNQFDTILNPPLCAMIRHKKNINTATLAVVALSFGALFFPAFQKNLGSLSWALLLAILFLSPLAKITRSKTLAMLMCFRRDMGILMGVFALEHSLLYFIKFNINLGALFNANFWLRKGTMSYLGWGTIAMAITIILLATSNNLSVRLLKNYWKPLQRLAYLVLLLVALHIAFIKYHFFNAALIVIGYILLKIFAKLDFKLS